jgi:hypothetical protein
MPVEFYAWRKTILLLRAQWDDPKTGARLSVTVPLEDIPQSDVPNQDDIPERLKMRAFEIAQATARRFCQRGLHDEFGAGNPQEKLV